MYTQNPCDDYVDSAAKQCIQIHLTPSQGDILVFMPGQEEIETTCDVIAGDLKLNLICMCTLTYMWMRH